MSLLARFYTAFRYGAALNLLDGLPMRLSV
jgi:hypothetical protein